MGGTNSEELMHEEIGTLFTMNGVNDELLEKDVVVKRIFVECDFYISRILLIVHPPPRVTENILFALNLHFPPVLSSVIAQYMEFCVELTGVHYPYLTVFEVTTHIVQPIVCGSQIAVWGPALHVREIEIECTI